MKKMLDCNGFLIRNKQWETDEKLCLCRWAASETSERKHKGNAALGSCNTILFIHSAVLDFDRVWICWNANYFTKWCKAFMFHQNLLTQRAKCSCGTCSLKKPPLYVSCARINKACLQFLTVFALASDPPRTHTHIIMCMYVLNHARSTSSFGLPYGSQFCIVWYAAL